MAAYDLDSFDWLAPPAEQVWRPSGTAALTPEIDLSEYEKILLGFSGGKDSLVCLLHLLDCGVPPSLIELHHQAVDGHEGSTLMEWPVTEAYCRAVAKAFGIPLYVSWKKYGFEGEMLRQDALTAPIMVPLADGSVIETGGTRGELNTRMRFPQQSASLSTRWCSSSCKIEVMARVITSNERFLNSKTLVVTGERASESANRANYKRFEPHRTDRRAGRLGRHVDHWRPVHQWSDSMVWDCIKRFSVNCHPAYHLGYGRCSCQMCVFGGPNQWATNRDLSPVRFEVIAKKEEQFGVTIHRVKSVREMADSGTSFAPLNKWRAIALAHDYNEPIFIDPWVLPIGAFGEACGPS